MPADVVMFTRALEADPKYELAGDALLDAAVIQILIDLKPDEGQAKLDAWKVFVVNNNSLARLTHAVGIVPTVHQAAIDPRVPTQYSANVFEAWIYALYKADNCDAGLAWKRVLAFVSTVIARLVVLPDDPADPTISLNVLAQSVPDAGPDDFGYVVEDLAGGTFRARFVMDQMGIIFPTGEERETKADAILHAARATIPIFRQRLVERPLTHFQEQIVEVVRVVVAERVRPLPLSSLGDRLIGVDVVRAGALMKHVKDIANRHNSPIRVIFIGDARVVHIELHVVA